MQSEAILIYSCHLLVLTLLYPNIVSKLCELWKQYKYTRAAGHNRVGKEWARERMEVIHQKHPCSCQVDICQDRYLSCVLERITGMQHSTQCEHYSVYRVCTEKAVCVTFMINCVWRQRKKKVTQINSTVSINLHASPKLISFIFLLALCFHPPVLHLLFFLISLA